MNKRIVWVITLIFTGMISVFGLVKPEQRVHLDHNLVRGKLENGLEYHILPNSLPENRVEVRMVVDAGSVLERDDQLGLAHFLEHMAFNGTRDFPKNELVDYLQTLGVEFGPEINAHTSFDETVYKLSVDSHGDGLEQALHVMQQWAFHISLLEEDIQAERPVVLEEWRASRNAMMRMQEAAYPHIYRDSMYGIRVPIGTRESLETFESQSLRDFYNDWYRPELMNLIVVGHVDPRETERLISQYFSDYMNNPQAPERPFITIPDHEEDIYTLNFDGETTYGALEVMKKIPEYSMNSRDSYKRYITEQLYLMMFNNRIAVVLREGASPFIDGYASINARKSDKDIFSLGMISGGDSMLEGFRAFWTEKVRMERFGFSQGEWEQAKQELRATYQNMYNQRETLYSSDLVEMVQYSVINEEPYPSMEWEWQVSSEILDTITLEEVLNTVDPWLEPGNRVILSMEQEEAPRLTREDIEAVMADVEAQRILPREEEEELGELVPMPPPPGTILDEQIEQLWLETQGVELTRLTLSNGARVFLLPTELQDNEILFRAVSAGGASLVELENTISASLATTAVSQSGLGDYSTSQLERLVADKYISINPSLEDYTESISGFSTPEDLEILFQMVYLYFTAPTYEEASWMAYESRLRPYLESMESDPMEQYRRMMTRVMYNDHPRRQPLTAQSLDEMDYHQAFRIFKQRFLTGGDFDFFLVGNFQIDEIKPLLRQWVACLPPQGERETWQDVEMAYSLENGGETLNMGSDPLAVVTLAYTGTMEWSFWESFRLSMLASALEDRLTEVIREEMGGSYSVAAQASSRDIPQGEYAFYFQFSCDPLRVEELKAVVQQEIQFFLQGEGLEVYASNLKEAQLSSYEENRQSNRWWLDRIAFSYSLNREVDQPRDYKLDDYIGQVSAEMLQSSAVDYLQNASALQEIILLPEE